jgi:hypothetical protein
MLSIRCARIAVGIGRERSVVLRNPRIWVVIWILALPAGAQDPDYRHVNDNLRRWLAVIEEDRPYILVDRQIGEVRLMQRKAVMRVMPILESSFSRRPESPSLLVSRLRRYRPNVSPGAIHNHPFDWEDNLASSANDRCALLFKHGLLLFAHREWGQPTPPWIRIGTKDLVALYNAIPPDAPLIILPPDWQQMRPSGHE